MSSRAYVDGYISPAQFILKTKGPAKHEALVEFLTEKTPKALHSVSLQARVL